MIESPMVEKALRYISGGHLIAPGERVCVAVSGGADSVALLRVLLELQGTLGVVLSVAHFNHKIRGEEAEADALFVQDLARQFGLVFHLGSGDAPAHAIANRISLETAARELRHRWFASLIEARMADKIATAHTQDDQAETVLMRILRGAGSRGLGGIAPWHAQKSLVRPLLAVTRREVEAYLSHQRQPWREDASNRDVRHLRNRIRHELLPRLQEDYNPAIRQTLADLAEVARSEEDYWQSEIAGLAARLVRSGKPSRSGRSNGREEVLAVGLVALQALPLAAQGRLVRFMGEQLGVALEFKHVQQLLALAANSGERKAAMLPGGLTARCSHRELQIARGPEAPETPGYCYSLSIPGQVAIEELGTTIRAQVLTLTGTEELSLYNSGLLNRAILAPEITVRNWRAGDRFFPAHTRSPKKVKELLQAARLGRDLSPDERKNWPVIESAGEIIWMRGFPSPQAFWAGSGEAVFIEEIETV